MTNLVVLDLVAGTAHAFVDRERVAGGELPGWDRSYQFERGKLELFRQVPTTYRFNPAVNAHDEGRCAFRRGALRSGNPFPACSPDSARWDAGWRMEGDAMAARVVAKALENSK